MNIIRRISSIKDFIATCILWKVGNQNRTEQSPIYFIDGLIAINSDESMMIGVNQNEFYCFNVGEYQAIREKMGLKDKDVFIGRDGNYLLFRDGELSIKTKNLKIEAEKIIFNGVEITSIANKILLNGKEIAVVGGDINTTTNKITGSGQ